MKRICLQCIFWQIMNGMDELLQGFRSIFKYRFPKPADHAILIHKGEEEKSK